MTISINLTETKAPNILDATLYLHGHCAGSFEHDRRDPLATLLYRAGNHLSERKRQGAPLYSDENTLQSHENGF